MKLRKFNEINNSHLIDPLNEATKDEDFDIDDVNEPPFSRSSRSDNRKEWISKFSGQIVDDEEAKLAAKRDLESDPGYKKLADDYMKTSVYGFDDDDPYSSDTYSSKSNNKVAPKRKESSEITPEQEDVVQELTYLLRKMITGSGISNFSVHNEGYDIYIQFVLQKIDKMRSIIRITNIIKKISDDILIQYDSEIELWETKSGEPLFSIDFYYDANKRGYKKNVNPFD